jgi:putative heme iron utilization protein
MRESLLRIRELLPQDCRSMNEPPRVLRDTDADSIRLAKTLIRTARSGTLATLDPATGRPMASRVGIATDTDGTPTTLISRLAAHTSALVADPRCSLLIGYPGKGDPLAHARITLSCDVRRVGPQTAEYARIAARYLRHNEKAALYAALPDFSHFRLEVLSASLNAGFGRAYALVREEVLSLSGANDSIAELEPSAIAHMNADHSAAVGLYAQHFAKAPAGKWVLTGIDAEGIDVANSDDVRRVWFAEPLTTADEVRPLLLAMAKEARAAFE